MGSPFIYILGGAALYHFFSHRHERVRCQPRDGDTGRWSYQSSPDAPTAAAAAATPTPTVSAASGPLSKPEESWDTLNMNPLSDSFREARDWSVRTASRLDEVFNKFSDRIQEQLDSANPADLTDKGLGMLSGLGAAPSARQYARCVENNGKSGWSTDGAWRCLYPNSPDKDRKLFPDYSQFLEYRRKLDEQARKEREAKAKALSQSQPQNQAVAFPNFAGRKVISEAEAAGKKVVGEKVETESLSRGDGVVETRQRTTKYYDDNTASVTSSGSGNGSGNGSDSKSSWLWTK